MSLMPHGHPLATWMTLIHVANCIWIILFYFYFFFLVSGDIKIADLVKEHLQTKEKIKMRGRRYVRVESRNEKTGEEGANSFQKKQEWEGKYT
jgi:hypothetical protein